MSESKLLIQDSPLLDVRRALHALGDASWEYDEDFREPTEAAKETAEAAVGALLDTALASRVPPGRVAPIGDGGISLRWDRGDAYVWALVPRDPSLAYVYQRAPGFAETVDGVTGASLHAALDWLVHR